MVGLAALSGCPAARQAGWTSRCPAEPPVCLSAVRSLASSLAGSEGGNNMHHHGIACFVGEWRHCLCGPFLHYVCMGIYSRGNTVSMGEVE